MWFCSTLASYQSYNPIIRESTHVICSTLARYQSYNPIIRESTHVICSTLASYQSYNPIIRESTHVICSTLAKYQSYNPIIRESTMDVICSTLASYQSYQPIIRESTHVICSTLARYQSYKPIIRESTHVICSTLATVQLSYNWTCLRAENSTETLKHVQTSWKSPTKKSCVHTAYNPSTFLYAIFAVVFDQYRPSKKIRFCTFFSGVLTIQQNPRRVTKSLMDKQKIVVWLWFLLLGVGIFTTRMNVIQTSIRQRLSATWGLNYSIQYFDV